MSGNTFAVPAHALDAWESLHRQILDTGPTPCAGAGRDRWTGTEQQQRTAADACMDCAVLRQCAAYADTADEREGTWGGYTARERQIRRGGAR
ncbi:MAG: hypothetical protein DI611_03910 [Brachybacterium faecium]|nr:MAG: hypothetical protein DI611_03910 [Brachybacterium faecium]